MKFILTFCFCILAFSESIESKNKKLRRTNEVLLKTLRELAVGEERGVSQGGGEPSDLCEYGYHVIGYPPLYQGPRAECASCPHGEVTLKDCTCLCVPKAETEVAGDNTESEVSFRAPILPFAGDYSCIETHVPSDCCWTGYYVPPNPPRWVTSQGYSCHGGRVLAKDGHGCLCVPKPAQPEKPDRSWRRVADVRYHCLPNDWCDQKECSNQYQSQGVATWEAFSKHLSSESGSACLERAGADSDCGDYAFFKAGWCFCTRASGSNDCVRFSTWAGEYEVHTRG